MSSNSTAGRYRLIIGFISHIKAAKKFTLRTLMSSAPPAVEPPALPPRRNVLPVGSDHDDVEDEEDYRHGTLDII